MGEILYRGRTLHPLGEVHEVNPSAMTAFTQEASPAAPFVVRYWGVDVLYVEPGDPVRVTVLDVVGDSSLTRFGRDSLASLDRALGPTRVKPEELPLFLEVFLGFVRDWAKMNALESARRPRGS